MLLQKGNYLRQCQLRRTATRPRAARVPEPSVVPEQGLHRAVRQRDPQILPIPGDLPPGPACGALQVVHVLTGGKLMRHPLILPAPRARPHARTAALTQEAHWPAARAAPADPEQAPPTAGSRSDPRGHPWDPCRAGKNQLAACTRGYLLAIVAPFTDQPDGRRAASPVHRSGGCGHPPIAWVLALLTAVPTSTAVLGVGIHTTHLTPDLPACRVRAQLQLSCGYPGIKAWMDFPSDCAVMSTRWARSWTAGHPKPPVPLSTPPDRTLGGQGLES